MARDLNEAWGWIQKLVQRVSRLESGSMLENSSISKGRMRFIGGLLRLDSGARLEVVGTAEITGKTDLNGPVNIAGDTTVTGLSTYNGNVDINGILNVDGPCGINGLAFLRGNVTVEAGGTITVGGVTIDPAAGGRIIVTGAIPVTLGVTSLGPGLSFGNGAVIATDAFGLILQSPSGNGKITLTAVAATLKVGTNGVGVTPLGTNITGPFTAPSKSFKIPHPLKDDIWLLHGVTESPVHGVEYWGDETIGTDGSFRVELPDYFEALTLEEGRAVFIAGRGHCPDWSDVEGTHFVVTGEPGKRFSWLVKAARSDVILETEEPMEPVTAP